jgi:hypothetical protein
MERNVSLGKIHSHELIERTGEVNLPAKSVEFVVLLEKV